MANAAIGKYLRIADNPQYSETWRIVFYTEEG